MNFATASMLGAISRSAQFCTHATRNLPAIDASAAYQTQLVPRTGSTYYFRPGDAGILDRHRPLGQAAIKQVGDQAPG